jgi:hypothetical protein
LGVETFAAFGFGIALGIALGILMTFLGAVILVREYDRVERERVEDVSKKAKAALVKLEGLTSRLREPRTATAKGSPRAIN